MSRYVQTVPIERIRGPDLAVFRTRSDKIPYADVLVEVDTRNLVIASNLRLTKVLASADRREWNLIKGALACHTGTHTAYIEPDTILDEKSLLVITDLELERAAGTRYFVEYVDPNTKKHWLYPVHPDYLGEKDVILASNHPNYTLYADGNRIIPLPVGMNLREAVDLVRGFPAENGVNPGDSKYDIPVTAGYGSKIHLHRTSRRVGPVRRGLDNIDGFHGWFSTIIEGVDIRLPPSHNCGTVVEVPARPVI